METKFNYKEFEKDIKEKGIEYLVHFTPTINLLSIFEKKKLLSRALIEKFDLEQTDILDYVEFTDPIRYDDKSYINLSIQHPNTFLFRKFVERTRLMLHITWCVIKIDPKYIYQKETLFSVTNAANSYNKKFIGVSGDIEKFRIMFAPSIKIVTSYNSKTLKRHDLKNKYPTDEQAEVLVKDEIPISDILEVCFKCSEDLAAGKAALYNFDTKKFTIDTSLFKIDRT